MSHIKVLSCNRWQGTPIQQSNAMDFRYCGEASSHFPQSKVNSLFLWKWVGISVSPTHFSFLPILPPRFHLQTVRLITDFIITIAIVDIRTRTRSVRWHHTTSSATRPQIRHPHSALRSLREIESGVAGTSALPPEYS